MKFDTAIQIIESCNGFTDETTPVGLAWSTVLAKIEQSRADLDANARLLARQCDLAREINKWLAENE